jgi:hypothetical protein
MIFPIRPTATETRRIEDVSVRAIPAVTGITAARGFNQPGVVVTIGEGARNLARSGQEPGPSTQQSSEPPVSQEELERVFASEQADAGVDAVFQDERGKSPTGANIEDGERVGTEEEEEHAFESVWEADDQSGEGDASGVPYAALQRAASVQDLDVEDVAQALAHTQIAVRVLATQDADVRELSELSDEEEQGVADGAETARLSSVPTDGVPYEALQRAVTEAESVQGADADGVTNSSSLTVPESQSTEPIFLAPENGGAPWGREVPFEEEAAGSVHVDQVVQPQPERALEAQA